MSASANVNKWNAISFANIGGLIFGNGANGKLWGFNQFGAHPGSAQA
jgi:hypothetical protein